MAAHTTALATLTAASALFTLPVFAFYYGISVPMVYDLQAHMAHRSFFDALFNVTTTSSQALAPSLAGFAAAAGVIGAVSLICMAIAAGKGDPVLGSFAAIGIFVAGCFACTAIALAMYEQMVLSQSISTVVHEVGITMGVFVGITAVAACATAIASLVD